MLFEAEIDYKFKNVHEMPRINIVNKAKAEQKYRVILYMLQLQNHLHTAYSPTYLLTYIEFYTESILKETTSNDLSSLLNLTILSD